MIKNKAIFLIFVSILMTALLFPMAIDAESIHSTEVTAEVVLKDPDQSSEADTAKTAESPDSKKASQSPKTGIRDREVLFAIFFLGSLILLCIFRLGGKRNR